MKSGTIIGGKAHSINARSWIVWFWKRGVWTYVRTYNLKVYGCFMSRVVEESQKEFLKCQFTDSRPPAPRDGECITVAGNIKVKGFRPRAECPDWLEMYGDGKSQTWNRFCRLCKNYWLLASWTTIKACDPCYISMVHMCRTAPALSSQARTLPVVELT